MKNIITLITILLIITTQSAHTQPDSIQRQINTQVWKPFIQTFSTGDEEGFKAVHSKDVLRIIQDNNTIKTYDQYFPKLPDSTKAKRSAWKQSIQLRFIRRMATTDNAFDVGYYKTTSTDPATGETRTSYGKFHVLLRKENGTWKILLDTDARENTNEAVFMSAKPMDEQ